MEIDGEVSFDLEVPSRVKGARGAKGTAGGTAGPRLECSYQHPEQAQIDAMLSNMMNALTKVFVRAYDFFSSEDGRRRPETRFRVVDAKKTQFFEHIYHNMTHEFRQFYNSTAERVDRSGRNPCLHQDELKQTWRSLLDHSLATFRHAALRCVEERLRLRETGDDKFKESSDDRVQQTDHDRVWKIDDMIREIGSEKFHDTTVDKVWAISDDSIRETGHDRIMKIGDDVVQEIRGNRGQKSSDDRVRETGDISVREANDDARVREIDDDKVWGTGSDRLRESKERARSRLGQFLMRELANIRASQLNMLCETFQLCYNDLL